MFVACLLWQHLVPVSCTSSWEPQLGQEWFHAFVNFLVIHSFWWLHSFFLFHPIANFIWNSVKIDNSNCNVFWVVRKPCYLDCCFHFEIYPNVSTITHLPTKNALWLQIQVILALGAYRDVNGLNTDGYYWYRICFHIFVRIRSRIQIVLVFAR